MLPFGKPMGGCRKKAFLSLGQPRWSFINPTLVIVVVVVVVEEINIQKV